jgi:hypothetical protein
VRFRLSDAFLPGAEELQAIFRDADKLEGCVIDFSDSGAKPDAFAVVEIIQRQTVVVPVEKLELAGGSDDLDCQFRHGG